MDWNNPLFATAYQEGKGDCSIIRVCSVVRMIFGSVGCLCGKNVFWRKYPEYENVSRAGDV